MLNVQNLNKWYGPHAAVNDLSFSLEPGDRVLLLGANGAGKSTLLKLCSGLALPDSGTIACDEALVYQGHELGLYVELSVEENLKFFSTDSEASVDDAIDNWGLSRVRHTRVSELSRGESFRSALCRNFLRSPALYLLDEPSSSLDNSGVEILISELDARIDENRACLIATHDILRLYPFANRIVLIENGAVAEDIRTNGADDTRDSYDRITAAYLERSR